MDSNHQEITTALRRAGASVLSLAAVGKGCPDLLVCAPGGRLYLVEVKDRGTAYGRRGLSESQQEFARTWGGEIHVVSDSAMALQALGLVENPSPTTISVDNPQVL